jgi:hypothetical protein
MIKLKSFSRLGLSGKRLTDVMVGGELAFFLEGTSLPLRPSQDKGMAIKERRRNRIMALIKDRNP